MMWRISFWWCVALCLSGCGYSSLQQGDENVKASWSEVVSLYQRRADLISGLAATVKDISGSQQGLIGSTEARAKSSTLPTPPAVLNDPRAFASYQDLQKELSQSVQSLMGATAAYPQLQADPNFRDLQAQLAETENNIAAARDHYRAAVNSFNSLVRTFPTDVTARMFDFHPQPNLAGAADK
jgi:LemA protein